MNIWTPKLEIHQKWTFSPILSHIAQNTNQTLPKEIGTSKTTKKNETLASLTSITLENERKFLTEEHRNFRNQTVSWKF